MGPRGQLMLEEILGGLFPNLPLQEDWLWNQTKFLRALSGVLKTYWEGEAAPLWAACSIFLAVLLVKKLFLTPKWVPLVFCAHCFSSSHWRVWLCLLSSLHLGMGRLHSCNHLGRLLHQHRYCWCQGEGAGAEKNSGFTTPFAMAAHFCLVFVIRIKCNTNMVCYIW